MRTTHPAPRPLPLVAAVLTDCWTPQLGIPAWQVAAFAVPVMGQMGQMGQMVGTL